jgi:uncharacterized Fe-S cluster-containing MiaB family protein
LLEERIALLGALGVRLTSYVMLKPAPGMDEEDGVREALATIAYLAEQCARYRTALVIYLNPTYIAEGSMLESAARAGKFRPPTIQSVFRVVVEGQRFGAPIYTGLWSEGLAEDGNDFRGHEGYDPELRKALVHCSRTGDLAALTPYLGSAPQGVSSAAA